MYYPYLRGKQFELIALRELVSSHTFRRSGASALYRAGVPAKVIRFLTGHKSDKTLFLYIKLNAEDGYQSLAGLEFFK